MAKRKTAVMRAQKATSAMLLDWQPAPPSRRTHRLTPFKTMALITTILMAIVVFSLLAKANRETNDKLNKTLKTLSEIEANIKNPITTLMQEPVDKAEMNVDLSKNKSAEIAISRSEQPELQDENKSLPNKPLVQNTETDARILTLQDNLSWIQEKHEEELLNLRNAKDREIQRINKTISRLEIAKASTIPPLIAALDHPDANVRSLISRALTSITKRSLGTDKDLWRKWWRSNRSEFMQSK